MIKILHEKPGDIKSVHEINLQAFETEAEADLVDKLRGVVEPYISLVAKEDDQVLGHILFTPVSIANTTIRAMGLGPMAVSPCRQGQGIGSSLIKQGLQACTDINVDAVFVLGEPEYYTRFGFEHASNKGLYYKSEKFGPYFFVLELSAGSIDGLSGEVEYHELFDDV